METFDIEKINCFKIFLQNTQLISFIFQLGHYVYQHQLLQKILSNDELQKLDKLYCKIKFEETNAKNMKSKRDHFLMNGMSLSLKFVYSQIIDHRRYHYK